MGNLGLVLASACLVEILYLLEYPDYKIHVHQALRGGDGVAIIGHTSGSHIPPEIEKEEILVWTADISDSLILSWRIYSNTEYARRS